MITIHWTNAAQKAAGVAGLSSKVVTHHPFDWADDVAKAGENTIRDIARVDTGWMRDSVGSTSTAMGGVGIAVVGYGVQQAHPFYTKFQEFGTRHGIQPMNSLIGGAQAMSTEISNSGTRMMGRIKGEWDAI